MYCLLLYQIDLEAADREVERLETTVAGLRHRLQGSRGGSGSGSISGGSDGGGGDGRDGGDGDTESGCALSVATREDDQDKVRYTCYFCKCRIHLLLYRHTGTAVSQCRT